MPIASCCRCMARGRSRADAPRVYDLVADLAVRAGIPMPQLYLIDGAQPNAFATGRDPHHAAVAVTSGLLNALDEHEVAGVIAHELSHVIHRDTLTMTITATIAGAISMLANFAFFFGGRSDERTSPLGGVGTVLAAILAPIMALLVQMAISRTREYEADRSGAELSGNPLWLASALRKIEAIARGTAVPEAERNPATAHLFIVNPLHAAGLQSLFATHPSTEERVRPLDDAIEDNGEMSGLPARDRAFARLLVATVLRRLGQIDALIAHCLNTPLPPRAAMVHDMLRLGIAQLLFLRTPPHAAVATTVDLAELRGFISHKGLVNAVLRRLSQEGPGLVAQQDAARLDTPDWLWRGWSQAYGEERTRGIALAHLKEAPLDLTVRRDPETWRDQLEAILLPTGTLRRTGGGAIMSLPGYSAGAWWVQDAAAAMPATLFGDIAGQRVVDLCAAPGGKTAQLAAAGARVTAIDRSPRRLDRLNANLARLSFTVESLVADAATWRPPEPVRYVLLDAPCTATGAIRRHPDVPHLKTPDDVARLAAVQERLVAAAVEMLAPGGTLVYCTCSLEPQEGPQQVAKLMARGAPVTRRPIAPHEIGGLAECLTPEGDLRTLPSHLSEFDGIDGFFATRLVRTA